MRDDEDRDLEGKLGDERREAREEFVQTLAADVRRRRAASAGSRPASRSRLRFHSPCSSAPLHSAASERPPTRSTVQQFRCDRRSITNRRRSRSTCRRPQRSTPRRSRSARSIAGISRTSGSRSTSGRGRPRRRTVARASTTSRSRTWSRCTTRSSPSPTRRSTYPEAGRASGCQGRDLPRSRGRSPSRHQLKPRQPARRLPFERLPRAGQRQGSRGSLEAL